jgi:hypothetical protein
VIRTCSGVMVCFCGFMMRRTRVLLTCPAIVILYTEVVNAVFDGSFADCTEMGVASSLCL